MSAPRNDKLKESRIANQNTCREEQEMSAPASRGQSKLNGAIQEIKITLEELEMKLATDINNLKTILSEGLRLKTTATILGGLALGAILMTATALPLGTAYGDGPSRPLISEETRIDDDAWIYHSPFYQDFSAVDRNEVQGDLVLLDATGDAWMYDSPFYQDFSQVDSTEVRGAMVLLDATGDAWMYDTPFFQDFAEVDKIEVRGTLVLMDATGDAWMYDSPFFQDFSAVDKIEVRGTLELLDATGDAWMYHSPFFQDFSAVDKIEAETTAQESLNISEDAWD